MTYPGALDSFTTKTDSVDTILAAHMNAVQAAIVTIETELGTDPAGTATDVKTRLAKSLSDAGLLNFATATLLTIASGSITATQNYHRVDTESSAASDNLDTITAGAEGQVLFLRSNSSSRDVVIRHAVGNIVCSGSANITLSTTADLALLVYDAVLASWIAWGGSAGTDRGGDVTGPDGGVTDGDLVTFDGTTGKLVKKAAAGTAHAAVTISDTASVNLSLTGQALSADVLPAGIKLDDFAATDDNTDLNASTGAHGLLPKLGGGTTNFLRADGTWAAAGAGLSGLAANKVVYATAADAVATDTYLHWDSTNKRLAVGNSGSNVNSNLNINGSESLASNNLPDADYTATATDRVMVMVPSVSRTITLPALSGCAGRVYTIINDAVGVNLVVDGNSSETINGAATYTLNAQYKYVTIMAFASLWRIIAAG